MSLSEGSWHTSSYSNQSGGECLEARCSSGPAVDLRDSRHPDHGHLSFPAAEWRAFLAAARQDRL